MLPLSLKLLKVPFSKAPGICVHVVRRIVQVTFCFEHLEEFSLKLSDLKPFKILFNKTLMYLILLAFRCRTCL